MADQYIGEIRMVGFDFAPTGWALCNGQVLPISNYSPLFALIGTTYGGNGTTNFALPNMQSRIPMHYGTGPGLSTYAMGEEGGAENVTLLITQMPAHNHILNVSNAGGDQLTPGNHILAAESSGAAPIYSDTQPNSTMNVSSIGLAGNSQSHENRQPFLVVNFIIALEGIFPSRS